jgi:ACS family hexuronate transporter-like MFS transporter
MATDLFKRNEVATVTGMMGTCSNAGVLFFNLLIGAFVIKIGYTPFFIAVGLLDLVGAALLWLVVREPHRDTAPMPTA